MKKPYSNPHRASYEAAHAPYKGVDDYFARQEAVTGSLVLGEASALMANNGSEYRLPDGRTVRIQIKYGRTNRQHGLDDNASARVDANTSISVLKVHDGGKTATMTFAYDDFELGGDAMTVITRNYKLNKGGWEWRPTDNMGPVAEGLEGKQLEAFFQDITPPVVDSPIAQVPVSV